LHLESNQNRETIKYSIILFFSGCNTIAKNNKRHRYVGFTIKSSKTSIEKSEIIKEIRKQCKHIFNKDCRDMGIYLIRFGGVKGVVKCNHVEKENTIKLLKSINTINSEAVEIDTVGTSGTIKALLKKHLNHAEI